MVDEVLRFVVGVHKLGVRYEFSKAPLRAFPDARLPRVRAIGFLPLFEQLVMDSNVVRNVVVLDVRVSQRVCGWFLIRSRVLEGPLAVFLLPIPLGKLPSVAPSFDATLSR